MTWDAVGAIAELVAAFAVIVTLVFLNIQIRTNNELIRSAAREKTVDDFNQWRNHLASDPELTRIWLSGCAGSDDLSDEEQFRFEQMARTYFLLFRTWHTRGSESGAVEQEEVSSALLASELKRADRAGLRALYSQNTVSRDSEFSKLIREKLDVDT